MVVLVVTAVQEVQHQYQEAVLSYVRLMAEAEATMLVLAKADPAGLAEVLVAIMTLTQSRT